MINNNCNLCPRKCNIDRGIYTGFCGVNNDIYISKVMLHKFEEPCISGNCECADNNPGSGAIFFCGCNLRCIYCQNYNISQQKSGKAISITTLVNIFKQLEKAGALNINLVTPTHYTNQIIEALKIYKPSIPVVWNSSGYESPETIRKLQGLVDVFLIDFKYYNSDISNKLSFAKDYPEFAKQTILTARKLCPIDKFDSNGIMTTGLIIRHLCLPNCTNDSKDILDWINTNLGNNTIISIMSQYVPMHKATTEPLINRRLKAIEYKIVVSHAQKLEFNNAYIQELSSSNESYTPDFNNKNDDFEY